MGKQSVSRRTFLKTGSAGAALALTNSMVSKAHAAPSNKVYTCYDSSLSSGGNVDYAKAKEVYESLAKSMSGQSTVANAWKTIFPGASSSSKLCIKMNCLHVNDGKENHPVWNSFKAMIDSLKTVFTASNIYVIDNDLWKTNQSKVRLAYPSWSTLGIQAPIEKYGGSTVSINSTNFYTANSFRGANYCMGFHVGRPHCCYADHLSGCIKNFMGMVSTSTSTFKEAGGQKFHGGYTPFRELFQKVVMTKAKVFVSDNIFCCYDEREALSKVSNRITMSADPCAIDSYLVDFFKTVGGLRTAGKGVPTTVAAGGVGTTSYAKVNVTTTPTPVSITEAQQAIKGHKSGSTSESAVQTTIDKYVRKQP